MFDLKACMPSVTVRNPIEILPENIGDTRYDLTVNRPGLPKGALKICFFSDVHCCVTRGEPDRIMDILHEEEPDLVLCGGDNVVADKFAVKRDRGNHLGETTDLLNRIAADYTLYLAMGNHETRMRAMRDRFGDMYDDFINRLDSRNITLLDNRSAAVDIRGIPVRIYGFTMRAMYYGRLHHVEMPPVELREALGVPDPESVSILLAHNPACRRACVKWGADLTLSGHYHGGIMRVGGHRCAVTPDFRLFSSDAYGWFENKGKHVIITSGAGEHTIPVRIANPREIVSIILHVNDGSLSEGQQTYQQGGGLRAD